MRDKFTEAIARKFWVKWGEYCGRTWDDLEDNIKQEWLIWVELEILSLNIDGHRLAIVDDNAELPSFRNAVNKSYDDYMLGQEDMLEAGYVKEVKNDTPTE